MTEDVKVNLVARASEEPCLHIQGDKEPWTGVQSAIIVLLLSPSGRPLARNGCW
jgi:hypothetical protein